MFSAPVKGGSEKVVVGLEPPGLLFPGDIDVQDESGPGAQADRPAARPDRPVGTALKGNGTVLDDGEHHPGGIGRRSEA